MRSLKNAKKCDLGCSQLVHSDQLVHSENKLSRRTVKVSKDRDGDSDLR